MNALAGVVFFDPQRFDSRAHDKIVSALPRRPGATVAIQSCAGAVFAQRLPSHDARARRPVKPDAATLFAATARIDNRGELDVPPHIADTDIVLEAVRRPGDAALARLVGDFAFAYWDSAARELTLGRDCLGRCPLFFHLGRGFAAFASTYNILFALPDVTREIDEIMLGHFLVLNLREPRRTLYRGVERVPSRSIITVDPAGCRHRYYWSPRLGAPPPYREENDYVARARELLDQAVTTAIGGDSVALTLSGGLDSSGIAATAIKLGLGERLDCFTNVAPPDLQIDFGARHYSDERSKVEALARLYPQLRVNFCEPPLTHPMDADPARHFITRGVPVRNPNILGQFNALIETATAKHRILLDGNHGNLGLSWDGDDALLELFRAGRWRDFIRELRATARHDGRGLARTFHSDVVNRAMSYWLRRIVHRLKGRDPDSVQRYSALNPAFIAEHDFAARLRADAFDPWFGLADPRRGAALRAYYMFDHHQPGRDSAGLDYEATGVQRRRPLGDRRLLEFMLTVPEPMFRKGGVARSFARRVLADRLPREILDEPRRGVAQPAWFRALDVQRDAIGRDLERIAASPLASRILDIPRLKRLLDEWPKDEAAAQVRVRDYQRLLARGVHVGRFIRWVERGND